MQILRSGLTGMAAIALTLTTVGVHAGPGDLVDTKAVVSGPGKEIAREKVLSLMYHREDWSFEHYKLHYLENHAPLGLKYARNQLGYTIDFTENSKEADSITESWVSSADDFLNPANVFASAEDMAKVTSDRIGNGHSKTYLVEEKHVHGESLSSPLFKQTPGVKVVWFYHTGDTIPAAPKGGYRVVDNKVVKRLEATVAAGKVSWDSVPSDLSLVRMAWAHDLSDLGPLAPGAVIVSEYRYRASPWK